MENEGTALRTDDVPAGSIVQWGKDTIADIHMVTQVGPDRDGRTFINYWAGFRQGIDTIGVLRDTSLVAIRSVADGNGQEPVRITIVPRSGTHPGPKAGALVLAPPGKFIELFEEFRDGETRNGVAQRPR
jgi:hypothetical protein